VSDKPGGSRLETPPPSKKGRELRKDGKRQDVRKEGKRQNVRKEGKRQDVVERGGQPRERFFRFAPPPGREFCRTRKKSMGPLSYKLRPPKLNCFSTLTVKI